MVRRKDGDRFPRHHRCEASALSPLLRIRITLDRWVVVVVRERLPIDRNENDGLMPGRASHTDRRGHRSRARIDPLPHAGRRSRRLVIISRLHSSKPSFENALTISSGVATHPCSWAFHVILSCSRSSLRPVIDRIVFSRSQRRNRAGTIMCPEGVRAGAGGDSGREPPPWLTCPRRSTR